MSPVSPALAGDSLPLSHLGSPILSGLRCMNCPGTTWRMEDMAHFEKGQLPKESGKGTELRAKHPKSEREREPMACSLA